MEDVMQQLEKVKEAGRTLITLDEKKSNAFLLDLADQLLQKKGFLLAENKKDLEKMDPADPKYDRLLLTEARLKDIADSLKTVAALPSPLNITLEERTLPNGLKLKKMSVPIGVIGVIFEARPNVTVDVFALCFKAGMRAY